MLLLLSTLQRRKSHLSLSFSFFDSTEPKARERLRFSFIRFACLCVRRVLKNIKRRKKKSEEGLPLVWGGEEKIRGKRSNEEARGGEDSNVKATTALPSFFLSSLFFSVFAFLFFFFFFLSSAPHLPCPVWRLLFCIFDPVFRLWYPTLRLHRLRL